MVKKLTRMALVCLAMLCMSSVQSPILTRPTVRTDLFDGTTMDVFTGQVFTFNIYFTNTNRLFMFIQEDYQFTELTISSDKKDQNSENYIPHTVIINEYSTTKTFDITAFNKDGESAVTSLILQTPEAPVIE